MQRHLSPSAQAHFKRQALAWGQAQSPQCCCLDSNNQSDAYGRYDFILAVGAERQLELWETKEAFEQLKKFAEAKDEWLLGYLSYDLKNSVEDLTSDNSATQKFPVLHFFSPTYLLLLDREGTVEIQVRQGAALEVWEAIQAQPITAAEYWAPIDLKRRLSKEAYLEALEAIQEHIAAGDVYEMNFCQELYAEECQLSPLATFERLNAIAQTPFAAYYQHAPYHVLCGSPERFLRKRGREVIAQPIKGTIHRGATSAEDQALRQQLRDSEKDQAENVMIVDLMRNDLTKVSEIGSIKVTELFGIYSFERVSQMISTVKARLQVQQHWTDVLKATFPIGSMTGAPKVSSLKLIEQYEETTRGVYAGAVGYITPDGDFDFNVVIRSLLYDAQRQYLSCQVGGAIVYDSQPEAEYEECLLKAQTVLAALGGRLI